AVDTSLAAGDAETAVLCVVSQPASATAAKEANKIRIMEFPRQGLCSPKRARARGASGFTPRQKPQLNLQASAPQTDCASTQPTPPAIATRRHAPSQPVTAPTTPFASHASICACDLGAPRSAMSSSART